MRFSWLPPIARQSLSLLSGNVVGGSLLLLTLTGCTLDFSDTPGAGGASVSGATSTSTANVTTSTGSATGGSGGAPELSPFFRDGTRLKAIYDDYGGGAVAFSGGWFDTALDLDCSFQHFGTGDACVPASSSLGNYYEDASCQKPLVVYAATSCVKPTYATLQSPALACEFPTTQGTPGTAGFDSIYPVTSQFTQPTVYQKTTACSPVAVVDGTEYFSIGSALPLSMFVGATRAVEPRGGNLNEEVLEGNDGSWMLSRTFAGASYCLPHQNGGDTVCLSVFVGNVPTVAPGITYFQDATCSGAPFTPNYGFVRSTCQAPDVLRGFFDDANFCTLPDKYYAVGNNIGLPVLYQQDGTCSPFFNPNFKTAYTQGPEIAPGTTVPFLSTLTAGTGRLQGFYYGSAPDQAVSQVGSTPRLFTDTKTGNTCRADRFDDGVTRCVDSNAPSLQYAFRFADAACTEPVEVFQLSNCGVTAPTPTIAFLPTMQTCTGSGSSGLVGLGPYSGPVYSLSGNNCIPYTAVAGDTVVAPTTSVPLSNYATVTHVHP